jgi:ATP-dependent exoDNAse (exonuclease V) alpha subunit
MKKKSSNGPILYCAPTGKAASVIKKRVGKKAYTIHQEYSDILFNRNFIILL